MTDQDFDANARKLLLRRILEGSPDKAINYAPDVRNGQVGPLTIQISKILRQHAALWALEMRTRVNATPEVGRVEWLVHMRHADSEIKRYLANHHITRAA